MTKTEREALARLLLGIRQGLESLHETVSGVLQLVHATAEEQPEVKPRPRYMGDDEEAPG